MRLQAGVRVFEIELRGPDGETITTLERIWGHSAKTQVDPASLLAIIARKPRIWGESPIRNDFPETVRALLDRMDARTRSNLLDDIRAVAADCGFAATVKAVETAKITLRIKSPRKNQENGKAGTFPSRLSLQQRRRNMEHFLNDGSL